jgi:hypothetical protein
VSSKEENVDDPHLERLRGAVEEGEDHLPGRRFAYPVGGGLQGAACVSACNFGSDALSLMIKGRGRSGELAVGRSCHGRTSGASRA